jgi:hypothetical protein
MAGSSYVADPADLTGDWSDSLPVMTALEDCSALRKLVVGSGDTFC